MTTPCSSSDERRRAEALTRRAADGTWLNGIDYVEVSECHLALTVNLLRPLSAGLTKANVIIEGGARAKTVAVDTVVAAAGAQALTVTAKEPGDFSVYVLRLVEVTGRPEPPKGFDPRLAAADFVFYVECGNPLACVKPQPAPAGSFPAPEIDYLAKDYATFRRLMLDRLSLIAPNATDGNAADLGVALVELLAYLGDRLSYYQDAVATEAYLDTARRRTSVRRHARLLDYRMHDGACARAWVAFEVAPGWDQDLPERTKLLTRGADSPCIVKPGDLDAALDGSAIVFETCQAMTLRAARNRIRFYTWSDWQCTLPKGSTHATLCYEPAAPLELAAGDTLVFEQVLSATPGDDAAPDPSLRQAVKLTAVNSVDSYGQPLRDPLTGAWIVEIDWDPRDALGFDLCLTRGFELEGGVEVVKDASVARGNVALAEHGLTLENQSLIPDVVGDRYRPQIASGPLSFSYPAGDPSAAAALADGDVRAAAASITLELAGEPWEPLPDLLNCGGQSRNFVIEVENDGAFLRFGDGAHGALPPPEEKFTARYRVGNGQAGNVGAEALGRVVTAAHGIVSVRNPLPAIGGVEPETLERVKIDAPQAFRTPMRAVTTDDYARIAERHPEVQKAAAALCWTGSWYTVRVTVDRKGGKLIAEDPAFRADLLAHLNRFRLAGFAVDVNDPLFVPLALSLRIWLKPGYWKALLLAEALAALSNRDLPGGGQGLFHPDRFTFGQPVYLSQVHQAVLRIDGIEAVETLGFHLLAEPSQELKDQGYFKPKPLEVIRLDNDPNFAGNGTLDIDVQGGL